MTRRIVVQTPISGLDFAWRPGQFVDLPDEEAAKWADGVRASYADPQSPDDPEPTGDQEQADPGPDGPPAVEPPAANASAEAWRQYAIEHRGADPEQVADLRRDELRERYGPQSE